MKINKEGSVQGQTFSGDNYKGEYPTPNYGEESLSSYRERVDSCVERGFHLGDLTWADWQSYCMGSGQFQGVDSSDLV